MNCPKCFNPIQPNQRFCEVCGAQIGAAEMDMNKTVAADPYEAQPEQSQQEQSPWAEQPQQPQQEQSPWAEQPQQPQQEQSPWAEQPQQPQQEQSPWAQQPQQVQQEQSPWAQQPQQNQQEQSPWAQQPQQNQQVQSPWAQQPQQQQAQYTTPPQSQYNFSQQYQQYQQPSQYASSQQGYNNYGYSTAVTTQKKSNVKIIIIAVVSVLVVAGIVLGIIFGVRACSSNIHQLRNSNDVVLAEDDSINVNDSDAEKKISNYLVQSNASATAQSLTNEMNGGGTASIYAKGNAMVFEIDLAVDVDSSRREAFKSYMEQYGAQFGSSLQQGKTESGVNNMVIVIAAVDKNRETFYSKVYH